MKSDNILIREATPDDVNDIFVLIKELAEFEKAPHEVENSPELILRDGFGDNPLFTCFLAEMDGKVVGLALYYFRYSTWKGKRLYLEDIVVNENYRGHGVGKLLFDKMISEAQRTDCNGMTFQVLEWNEPAINFYKKFGANFDPEWINVSITKAKINEWLNNK
jgi:GNAT superfamily N-acetyltransferase